ncbi:MAG: 6-phosphofructokinase [Lachnospiraceae bacterium]|jgi:6-phosphofructokinase 1|nr:6-phosphofructokinase [Lachnospiraceae bacterium]
MKNLIVGQSGGPTAVINGSLYGVVTEGLKSTEQIGKVYGMVHGIEGFLGGQYMDMDTDMTKDELTALKTTPGAFLGSCRYKLPEDLSDPVYPELFKKFEELNIGYFFYCGGNDSMDTVSKLSRYAASVNSDIRVMGVPKTIDNDLVLTDHTPGFGSAAKFVASSVREINRDSEAYDKPNVMIIEIMGRHAGWLAASSVLARCEKDPNPLLIYLPEVPFSEEKFIKQLKAAIDEHKHVTVCVSEGLKDAEGNFISEDTVETAVDQFGHKILNGCGSYLQSLVKKELGVKVRSVEFNVSQRCSSNCLSATDLEEAVMAGSFAVQQALKGETGYMIAFNRKDGDYGMECALVDVNDVCNKEKTVPLEWITDDGSNLSQEFIDYAAPLVKGECQRPMKDGLPVFAIRNR